MASGGVCRTLRLLFALPALALFVVPRFSFAQLDQGSITGMVTETSGAVVSSADITLTNTDTGLTFRGKTDSNGIYTFSPMKIGNSRSWIT